MTSGEFMKMGVAELKTELRKMQKTAHSRLSRLEKAGLKTQAAAGLKRSGGRISVSTKGLSEKAALKKLRKEFTRAKTFLESETSTVSGYRSQKKRVSQAIGISENLSDKQYEKVWKAYEKLKEQNPEVESRGYRYSILKTLSDEIEHNPRKSVKSIVDKVDEMMKDNTIYEQSESGEDVSSFFETDENV